MNSRNKKSKKKNYLKGHHWTKTKKKNWKKRRQSLCVKIYAHLMLVYGCYNSMAVCVCLWVSLLGVIVMQQNVVHASKCIYDINFYSNNNTNYNDNWKALNKMNASCDMLYVQQKIEISSFFFCFYFNEWMYEWMNEWKKKKMCNWYWNCVHKMRQPLPEFYFIIEILHNLQYLQWFWHC